MRRSQHRLTPAGIALVLVVLAACGGKGGSSAGGKNSLVAEVANFDVAVGGPSRIIVGLLSGDQRFVVFGSVRFRFAYLGTKQDNAPGAYGPEVGARFLPIPGAKVPNPLPAKPIITSGADTRGVYAALASFAKAGFYQVEVTADIDGKEQKATAAMAVNDRHAVPGPGDPAPRIDNLTLASADAPKAAVDSRATTGDIPDPELHQTTVAAAIDAKRPAVVVISTPVYCQSRFCGPVTDLVADLAKTYADRASFIHIEVYRDGQNQVINKAAADWILVNGSLNEPWVFVVGADGKIMARFDNVVTQDELEPILKQLPVIGPAG